MKLKDRLKLAMAAFLPNSFFDRYEAGQRYSTRRSRLNGYVQDARFDADSATRIEILRKSRYFERNNGIVNRLADLFEQYTSGPTGLAFVPSSSDEEWNIKAKDYWDSWTPRADLTSKASLATMMSLCSRSWMIDGEIFINKTSGKKRAGQRSYPRIQLIESHRVETPPDLAGERNVIDGVEVDERGRPVAYWVRDESLDASAFGADKYNRLKADDIVHLFEPSRPGMVRGLPMLYPVLNDLHDLDDLQLLEMDASKDAASITNVIKTKTGEIDLSDLRRFRMSVSGTDGTSGGSSQDRTSYYDEMFQGKAKVLQHGDEFDQFKSERPSVAVRDYWDYLTSKICAGVGISKLLVLPWSMQGTVARSDLDVASAFFRSRSAVLATAFSDVYEYVMKWGTSNVLEISDPPVDWYKVTVRPPRSVNVDVGRNAKALISEYSAGWRTLEEICGELGSDWRDVLRKRAVERRYARSLESEFDLEEGELIEAAMEAIQKSEKMEPAQVTVEET